MVGSFAIRRRGNESAVNVVNKTYHLILDLFDTERGGQLLLALAEKDLTPTWNDPK